MNSMNDLVKVALERRMELMARNNRTGVAFIADAFLNTVKLEVCDRHYWRGETRLDLRMSVIEFTITKDGEIIETTRTHL